MIVCSKDEASSALTSITGTAIVGNLGKYVGKFVADLYSESLEPGFLKIELPKITVFKGGIMGGALEIFIAAYLITIFVCNEDYIGNYHTSVYAGVCVVSVVLAYFCSMYHPKASAADKLREAHNAELAKDVELGDTKGDYAKIN